jgi:hypothetical protein
MHGEDQSLILKTAKQLASGLMRAIVTANGLTKDQRDLFRQSEANIHFHDGSQNEIAWNDVQAIIMHNEMTSEDLPIPFVASEGYNNHGHSSEYDGGWIPGMGIHDHRDAVTGGGFAFAVYHPGTGLPQQPWAV